MSVIIIVILAGGSAGSFQCNHVLIVNKEAGIPEENQKKSTEIV